MLLPLDLTAPFSACNDGKLGLELWLDFDESGLAQVVRLVVCETDGVGDDKDELSLRRHLAHGVAHRHFLTLATIPPDFLEACFLTQFLLWYLTKSRF